MRSNLRNARRMPVSENEIALTLMPDCSGRMEGVRSLTLGLEAPGSAPDPVRLSLRFAGVYPVGVELRDADGRTTARLVTFVVVVDQSHASTVYGYSESADSLMRNGLNVKSKASPAETRPWLTIREAQSCGASHRVAPVARSSCRPCSWHSAR